MNEAALDKVIYPVSSKEMGNYKNLHRRVEKTWGNIQKKTLND